MAEPFDPYYTWLGIPPDEQPADHYRLLGVRRFESSLDVIQNASDQRIAFLRSVQTGPRMRQSQQLLSEVAAAAGCLLDPQRKAIYDEALHSALGMHASAAAPIPPAVSAATLAASHYGDVAPPVPPPIPSIVTRRFTSRGVPLTAVMVGLGGVAGLILGAVILQHAFGINVVAALRQAKGPAADHGVAKPADDQTTQPPLVTADQPGKRAFEPPAAKQDENGPPTDVTAKASAPGSQSNATPVATSTSPLSPQPMRPATSEPTIATAPPSTAAAPPAASSAPPTTPSQIEIPQPSVLPLPRAAVVAEIPHPAGPPAHLAFRPDAKMFAAWSDQAKEVELWPIGGSQTKTQIKGSPITFSADSRQFAVIQTGRSDRGVAIYRFLSSGKLSDRVFLPITEAIRSVAFSEDAKQFFVALAGQRPLAAYVMSAQKLNDRIKTNLTEVAWVGVEGDLLVCCTSSGQVETISVSNARQHESLPDELASVPSLLFDHRGSPSLLAPSTRERSQLKFDVWNLKAKTRVTTPMLGEGSIDANLLAISSDGQLAAIRDPYGLTLVGVSSGEQVTRLEFAEGDFRAAALTTADGLLAVTGPANYLWIIDLAQLSPQPSWRIPSRQERLTLGYRAIDPPVGEPAATQPKPATAAAQRALPKGIMDAVFVKPGGTSSGGGNLVNGWEFVPKTAITVTHLGVYDHRQDGLATPHEVAIWDIDERGSVASATVPAGLQAPLVGTFRMAPVNRVKLEAGRSYAIVAHYPTPNDSTVSLINPAGLVIEYAPQLTVVGRRYSLPHQQMAFPDRSTQNPVDASIGPTFRFEVR